MASLTQINFESDSEDDPDFTPDAGADSDDDSNSQASAPSAKRTKLEEDRSTSEVKVTEEEARASAWAAFQTQVADKSSEPVQRLEGARLIAIEKRYIFAGEEVIKTIEVREDSKEGKAWLAARKSSNLSNRVSPPPPQPIPVSSPQSVTTAPFGRIDCPSSNNQTAKPPDVAKVPPAPRPKGGGLAALNKGRPKKLSTLEKSRMDWNTHVVSGDGVMKEELDANRRGGGYIEKVEFLGRVSDRMEDALENAKGGKRKR